MNHEITVFKYLYHMIDPDAFSAGSYVTPALTLGQAIEIMRLRDKVKCACVGLCAFLGSNK